MQEVNEESGTVTVQGEILSMDVKLRKDESFIVALYLSDKTGTLPLKLFLRKEEKSIVERIEKCKMCIRDSRGSGSLAGGCAGRKKRGGILPMSVISMKQLLEAGVHFGHQTRRWNPKMKEYIFTERNGIYIIDLQKTVKKIDEAYYFVRDLAMDGKSILFVGTKKQAQESIEQEAKRCEMFYVNQRWLGGMLTNFKTIQGRIAQLRKIEKMEADGDFAFLPKKEVIKLKAEQEKLEKNLGGIKDMKKLPGALFVVDPRKEHIAILEAQTLGIPVVAIVDTNCDPDEAVSYTHLDRPSVKRSGKIKKSCPHDGIRGNGSIA